jgi:hypothetical protein
MPRELAMLKWLAENDKPTPPAASMPKPVEKKVVDLAEMFMKAYSVKRRIA